jgi:hypothetical protein
LNFGWCGPVCRGNWIVYPSFWKERTRNLHYPCLQLKLSKAKDYFALWFYLAAKKKANVGQLQICWCFCWMGVRKKVMPNCMYLLVLLCIDHPGCGIDRKLLIVGKSFSTFRAKALPTNSPWLKGLCSKRSERFFSVIDLCVSYNREFSLITIQQDVTLSNLFKNLI